MATTPIVKIGGTVKGMEVLTTPGHGFEPDPKVFISTTADGALYGPEVAVSTGKKGEYQTRVVASRLGDYPLWFGLRIRCKSSTTTVLSGCEIT
jgi:hypothetical protein